MKKIISFIIVILAPTLLFASTPELGADFEWLNSIYVSLSTMALATYAATEVAKIKIKPPTSLISILLALGIGLSISMLGWLLKIGFLSTVPFYLALVYGLISTAIAAFGYDIIRAIQKVINESKQLNS